MDRRVDEDQLWISALQTLHRPSATVSGTVVDDPEDAASIVVWGTSHYLLDQAVTPALFFLFGRGVHDRIADASRNGEVPELATRDRVILAAPWDAAPR